MKLNQKIQCMKWLLLLALPICLMNNTHAGNSDSPAAPAAPAQAAAAGAAAGADAVAMPSQTPMQMYQALRRAEGFQPIQPRRVARRGVPVCDEAAPAPPPRPRLVRSRCPGLEEGVPPARRNQYYYKRAQPPEEAPIRPLGLGSLGSGPAAPRLPNPVTTFDFGPPVRTGPLPGAVSGAPWDATAGIAPPPGNPLGLGPQSSLGIAQGITTSPPTSSLPHRQPPGPASANASARAVNLAAQDDSMRYYFASTTSGAVSSIPTASRARPLPPPAPWSLGASRAAASPSLFATAAPSTAAGVGTTTFLMGHPEGAPSTEPQPVASAPAPAPAPAAPEAETPSRPVSPGPSLFAEYEDGFVAGTWSDAEDLSRDADEGVVPDLFAATSDDEKPAPPSLDLLAGLLPAPAFGTGAGAAAGEISPTFGPRTGEVDADAACEVPAGPSVDDLLFRIGILESDAIELGKELDAAKSEIECKDRTIACLEQKCDEQEREINKQAATIAQKEKKIEELEAICADLKHQLRHPRPGKSLPPRAQPQYPLLAGIKAIKRPLGSGPLADESSSSSDDEDESSSSSSSAAEPPVLRIDVGVQAVRAQAPLVAPVLDRASPPQPAAAAAGAPAGAVAQPRPRRRRAPLEQPPVRARARAAQPAAAAAAGAPAAAEAAPARPVRRRAPRAPAAPRVAQARAELTSQAQQKLAAIRTLLKKNERKIRAELEMAGLQAPYISALISQGNPIPFEIAVLLARKILNNLRLYADFMTEDSLQKYNESPSVVRSLRRFLFSKRLYSFQQMADATPPLESDGLGIKKLEWSNILNRHAISPKHAATIIIRLFLKEGIPPEPGTQIDEKILDRIKVFIRQLHFDDLKRKNALRGFLAKVPLLARQLDDLFPAAE